jgi:hypothetical protein
VRQVIPFSLDFQRAKTQNGPNRSSILTKNRNKFGTLPFGVSAIGISGCAMAGGLVPGFPKSRNSKTPNSKHAPLFRSFLHRDFGMCDNMRYRTWVSREMKLQNTKLQTCSTVLGFPPLGFLDVRRQEVSHLGLPGVETLKHHTLNMLYYFGVSSIGISGCATIRGLTPGFPGAETLKHQTLNILHYFGVSSIGILGCSMTGGLAPGFSGNRNSKTPNSKHTPLFWGFLHRDFRMCDDRRSHTWVSQEPKL